MNEEKIILNFIVKDRIIKFDKSSLTEKVVGDNTGYVANFIFDEEWTNKVKTARFIKDGTYVDVLLDDNDQCDIPLEVLKSGTLEVGVFAGNLRSSTSCKVSVKSSILESNRLPAAPTDDVYAQIIEKVEAIESVKKAVINDDGILVITLTSGLELNVGQARGVGIKSIEQTQKSAEDSGENIWTVTLTDNTKHNFSTYNGSKGKPFTFEDFTEEQLLSIKGDKGDDGQSAYFAAVEGGYSRTQEEFYTDLASVSNKSDYEQNDSSQPDYIKNRTHYKEIIHQEKVDLFPATEIDFSSIGDVGYSQSEPLNVQAGNMVKVLWDNQEYECKAQLGAAVDPEGNSGLPSDGIIFGNLYAIFGVDIDSQSIPFAVIANYTMNEQEGLISGCTIQPMVELTKPITVNIFTGGDKVVYHKLDLNYLPLSNSNISADENNIVTSKPLLNYLSTNKPDWDIDDRNDPRFIENRPFSRSLWGSTGSLHSKIITLDENGIYTSQEQLYNFNDIWDNSYGDINLTVHWHGGTYNCKLRKINTNWTDEYGQIQYYSYFVFGNVSSIDSNYTDTAPFLIYADFNPETHKIGETYVKAYDGFIGELTLQVDAEYRYWGYQTLDNNYLNINSLKANWDEENKSAPSFIYNKPFSRQKMSNEDGISGIGINSMFNDSGVCIIQDSYFNLNEQFEEHDPVDYGVNVFVKCVWNGIDYKGKVRHLSCEYYDNDKGSNITDYYYVFGNVSSIDSNYTDTAPFLVYANYNPETHKYGETYIVSQDGSTGEIHFEFSWVYDYWSYNPISNKYLSLARNVSENDENPVTSGAVYNAIQSAIGTALGGSY